MAVVPLFGNRLSTSFLWRIHRRNGEPIRQFLRHSQLAQASRHDRIFPSTRFYVTPKLMTKSVKVTPKKRRGRPATGRDPHVTSRMPPGLIADVEAWATANGTTRSEAIRRLVEIGLAKSKARSTGRRPPAALVSDLAVEAIDSLPPKPVGKPGKLRAQELAAKAIEKMLDPAAPAEERAQRRRRLTKGPIEFREARVDQPKTKGK